MPPSKKAYHPTKNSSLLVAYEINKLTIFIGVQSSLQTYGGGALQQARQCCHHACQQPQHLLVVVMQRVLNSMTIMMPMLMAW